MKKFQPRIKNFHFQIFRKSMFKLQQFLSLQCPLPRCVFFLSSSSKNFYLSSAHCRDLFFFWKVFVFERFSFCLYLEGVCQQNTTRLPSLARHKNAQGTKTLLLFWWFPPFPEIAKVWLFTYFFNARERCFFFTKTWSFHCLGCAKGFRLFSGNRL